MNGLILIDNDVSQISLKDEILNSLLEYLDKQNIDNKIYNTSDTKHNSCIGCFSCWVKTPGHCIFNNDKINKEFINSDILILISKVKYGTYSPSIKVILDTFIPNLSPLFKKINSEIHHKKRYKKYPSIISIGYGDNLSNKSKSTFHSIAKANSINFHSPKFKSLIIENLESAKNLSNELNDFFI